MSFYRGRAGSLGSNRALAPSYRTTAAAAAGSAFRASSIRSEVYARALAVGVDGIGSDIPGASVLVEQTGPDSVTISEIVDGQTIDQIVLPVVTVPAAAADAPAAAPVEVQTSRRLVGRVAGAVVSRMSWLGNGDGSYTITPGDDEVISISGDSSLAVVVAVPVPPG